jgi:hypothetical protein
MQKILDQERRGTDSQMQNILDQSRQNAKYFDQGW